jgi:carbamoyltransferase
MIYLGISQDRYDGGVAVTDGHRVLYAANEERFTRKKNQGGFPAQALAAAFCATGIEPGDVDRLCFAGIMTPPLVARAFPGLQRWLFREDHPAKPTWRNLLVDGVAFHTPLAHAAPDSLLNLLTRALLPTAARRTLSKPLRRIPMTFVEHHRAHAALAWYLSGFPEALCLTADGLGDGLSMTVSRCTAQGIERLWSAASRDSLGLFYDVVTEGLGFIPNRHEGKVTGLAAYGDPTRVGEPCPFALENGRLRYNGPHGRRGVAWVRDVLGSCHRREDIAGWAQAVLERHVIDVARHWLRRTGLSRLVLAGGVCANVKLNQRLHELAEVTELFVAPHMGDGGLSLGAISNAGGLDRQRVGDVFWGDAFSDAQMAAALRRCGLRYQHCPDIDARVAGLLADGSLVGRFSGRMEWGPRALGNRSVLARTTDSQVVARLNAALGRSEFMPFAPAVLDEDADAYFHGLDKARHAAQFMTACFQATTRMAREHPAVVHIDNTVRPQLVCQQTNPTLHALLCAYKARTGHPLLLNTSFNLHEEPIVRTPEQALDAFLRAKLDYLALGSHLLAAPGLAHTVAVGVCGPSA